MSKPGPVTPLANHRERMKQRGMVRVEVQVRKGDAELVRGVAGALADPDREVEMRKFLRERISGTTPEKLKALLADAPLEGIDLERSRDTGRDVDL